VCMRVCMSMCVHVSMCVCACPCVCVYMRICIRMCVCQQNTPLNVSRTAIRLQSSQRTTGPQHSASQGKFHFFFLYSMQVSFVFKMGLFCILSGSLLCITNLKIPPRKACLFFYPSLSLSHIHPLKHTHTHTHRCTHTYAHTHTYTHGMSLFLIYSLQSVL